MKKSVLIIQKSLITLTTLFVYSMIARLVVHIAMTDLTMTASGVAGFTLFVGFILLLTFLSASLLVDVLKSKTL